jgi:hypothetical protein
MSSIDTPNYYPCPIFLKNGNCPEPNEHTSEIWLKNKETKKKELMTCIVMHYHAREHCFSSGCEKCIDILPCKFAEKCKSSSAVAHYHFATKTSGAKFMVFHPERPLCSKLHIDSDGDIKYIGGKRVLTTAKIEIPKSIYTFPTDCTVYNCTPCISFYNPDSHCGFGSIYKEHEIHIRNGKTFMVGHYHPYQECLKKKRCRFCIDNLPICPDETCNKKLSIGCHLYTWADGQRTVVYHPQTEEVLEPVHTATVPVSELTIVPVSELTIVHQAPVYASNFVVDSTMSWGDMCE